VHGDRQCQDGLGGTDCLIRAFPPGYGIHLTDPMWTFYDFNDVRPKGSTSLYFFSEHVYRWTRQQQRQVGRFACLIPSNVAGGHDDYLLAFDADGQTEYVVWSDLAFLHNATFRHLFWHSHQEFTVDMWAISAPSSKLGLGTHPYDSHHMRLNDVGVTIPGAMRYILEHLGTLQQACETDPSCVAIPRLRCAINQDRWDVLESGEMQERYHAPHCNRPWKFLQGDVFTLVSFHKAQIPISQSELVWMHTVLYGYYTAWEPSSASLPQAQSAFPPELMPKWKDIKRDMYRTMHFGVESSTGTNYQF